MYYAVGHLVRRSADEAWLKHASSHSQNSEGDGLRLFIFLIICVFVVVVLCAAAAVDYTYGQVVGTLAAVEDSNPDIYIRIDNDPVHPDPTDPTKPFVPRGADEASFSQAPRPIQPITRGLRSAVRHLRARAGFWSRFRGLSIHLCITVPQVFIMSLVSSHVILSFLILTSLNLLFAPLHMAWVHIVISEPSTKRFYQRIPSMRTWIKIAPAIALRDVPGTAVYFVAVAIARSLGEHGQSSTLSPAAFGYGIPALLAWVVQIPAQVIFVRVAASMLPEEDETIVPFDRSFGGKVQTEIMGGSGHIGLLDAWRTFDWPARVRYGKVIIKTFAIEVFMLTAFFMAIFPMSWALKNKNS
ncbi:Uncharacterized protein PECH_005574 [Penicillium ucsense]|uniref:Uncharacterized protein n=1 Tax=Penicillium ucsense TaxID=2839758 RepID=A0A8J8WHN4_9EURO|nr:Uncharacterized protein PECM_007268 [Penicillium ucsense]KAF7739176.1 Uncharacterized protein PECH_005574 [Penicillium ucsense]